MRPGLFRRTALAGVVAVLAAGLTVTAAPSASAVTVKETYTRPANGVFLVNGHGWGHGRGMSQFGALGAAQLGKSPDTITSTYYPGTTRKVLANASIRVQIRSNTDHAKTVVRIVAGLVATDLATGTKLTPPSGATRWRVTPSSTGLRLASLSGSTWTTVAKTFAGPVSFSGPTFVRLDFPGGASADYRGAVRSLKTSSTTVDSLAVMPLESYLLGVVPRESPSSWPAAALQAQSIAARSYSAYQRGHAPSSRGYDICDTTQCQVFMGSAKYSSSGTKTALEPQSTTDAINATAGVVRAYDGGPIFAEFSSSNGGWSTDGSLPYLQAHRDDWDGVTGSSVNSWSGTLPVSALEAKFPSLGSFRKLTVTERDGNGEWGGRVLAVVLEGVDAAGAATSVTTTGRGIYNARVWPAYSDGLKSSWWHIVPAYATKAVTTSRAPRLVLSPGNPRGAVIAVLQNTGTVAWATAGLHLAVAASPGSADRLALNSTRPGVFEGNVTTPGATSIQPGESATFRVTWDATGLDPGVRKVSYRLRLGTAAAFGPILPWSVTIEKARFTAVQGAPPALVSSSLAAADGAPPALFADGRTVVVPRTGSTTVRLTSRNTGNLSWPAGAQTPFMLGTSGPRDRASTSAGSGWVATSRPSRVAGTSPVAPSAMGTFDVQFHGNGRAAGVTSESFEPLWSGQSWIGGNSTTMRVVRVDPAVPRAAVLDLAPATGFTLVNAPNGTRLLTVRLRNVGSQPWTVGTEQLGTSAAFALASGWPSSTRTPALRTNLSRPGQTAVHPGEVGEWRVPLSAYKHAAGNYVTTFRAVGPNGFYGPSLRVGVKVAAPVFTYTLRSVRPTVNVPSAGKASSVFYVKNTGNVSWPVGGSLRSTVRSGSPSRASIWHSATRPGSLTSNYTVAGSTVVRPGEVARFVVVLAGNGRTPRSTSEVFGMVWDGWKSTTLKATLAYRVV